MSGGGKRVREGDKRVSEGKVKMVSGGEKRDSGYEKEGRMSRGKVRVRIRVRVRVGVRVGVRFRVRVMVRDMFRVRVRAMVRLRVRVIGDASITTIPPIRPERPPQHLASDPPGVWSAHINQRKMYDAYAAASLALISPLLENYLTKISPLFKNLQQWGDFG